MKWRSLVIPFTFAAGMATGVYGKMAFDVLTATRPPGVGESFSGVVRSVYDGDTMTVGSSGADYRIRIWGIDAPERSQRCRKGREINTCGLTARDRMRDLVLEKKVSCTVKGIDGRYDRLVAQCFVGHADPVKTLVQEGWAFSDTRYSEDPYVGEQAEAQARKNGLWGMAYTWPARWRACTALKRGGGAIPGDCFKPLGPVGK